MVKNTPAKVPCTTFSILFSRFKGDINTFAHGAGAINSLKPGDKIAILEACTHHPIEDDIGRVKLPKWLNKKVGGNLKIDFFAGRDLPSTIKDYKVLIHCGACMLTKTEVLNRMEEARNENIPITNYGMAISECQGVLNRVLSPFPEALIYYQNGKKTF